MSPVTVHDIRELAAIVAVADKRGPVTWESGSGHQITATARGITDERGNHWHGDIRDGYLWMSGTWEHFVRVTDILDEVRNGTMALDYRP